MSRLGIVLFLLLGTNISQGQNEEEKTWSLHGYVKQLTTVIGIDLPPVIEDYYLDQLIHNRLNYRKKISSNLRLRVDMRNRLFFGDQLDLNPNFARQIEEGNNDYLDLSVHLINEESKWLLNSTIDRAFVEWESGTWEITIGRQRINWGIGTVWNPNDIFNAFAFTDFDYEERPGSDGIRLVKYLGFASSAEIAYKAGKTWDDAVLAGRWTTNIRTYDLQFLAGWSQGFWSVGMGWAGNLKNAGFKGELNYFLDHVGDENSFSLTASVDYTFNNGLYGQIGYLFNELGSGSQNAAEIFNFELSARNLYPYKHTVVITGSYPISPLVNSVLAILYSPVKAQALFVNPTLTVSISQSWDLDIVGQIAFNKDQDQFRSPIQAGFLRFKHSF